MSSLKHRASSNMATIALSCQADVAKLDQLLDSHAASALSKQVQRVCKCTALLATLDSDTGSAPGTLRQATAAAS